MIYLYSAGTQSLSIPQCIYAPHSFDLGAHQKAQIKYLLYTQTHTRTQIIEHMHYNTII